MAPPEWGAGVGDVALLHCAALAAPLVVGAGPFWGGKDGGWLAWGVVQATTAGLRSGTYLPAVERGRPCWGSRGGVPGGAVLL